MRATCIAVTGGLALLALEPLRGQTLQKSATPIDVSASPAAAAPGAAIKISGTTGHDGKQTTVAVVVTPPAGAPAKLSAAANAAGGYSVTYAETGAAGTYQIKATTPDGKSAATGSFTILTGSDVADATVAAMDDLVKAAAEADASVAQRIASMPASPPQQELGAKLDQLKTRLAEAPKQTAAFKQSWQRIQTVVDQYPALLPVFQPTLTQLADWDGQAKREAARIRQELNASASKGATCDTIDNVVQTLNWVSYALDFIGKPFEILRSLVTDKVLPEKADKYIGQLPVATRTNARFMFTEAIKFGDAVLQGPTAWVASTVSFAADLAAFAGQKLFDRFCEQFQGPFTASLHSDFFDHGRKYWTYDLDLSGQLVLRYAKASSSGQAIHFTGQYEGNATRATLWDDFLVIYPKMASDVMWHAARPPVVHPVNSMERWGGRLPKRAFGGSTSFTIPVEGDFIGDKIVVRLAAAAQHDLDLKGKVIYIFVAPGAFFPETVSADAPYQTAYWIISRGIGMKPEFTVTIDQKNRISIISRDFSREAKGGDDSYTASFKASVKACNPECP